MKVKDLIGRLQDCNQEAIVLMYIPHDYLIMDKVVENNDDDETPIVELYSESDAPQTYKDWYKAQLIGMENDYIS